MASELKKVLEQVAKEKSFNKEELINTIEEAVRLSALKKYGDDYDLEARYNENTGEVELYQFKVVVEDGAVRNAAFEIPLKEAKQYDASVSLGEDMGFPVDVSDMGRVAAQTAKQLIIQRMRETEQRLVYDEYKERRGEIVSGRAQRRTKNGWIISLGGVEALLLKSEQIPKEFIKRGDTVECLLLEVNKDSRLGAQLILSRAHPEYLHALFCKIVPEVADGVVQIVSIVRDPGYRSKVAVVSRDKDIDPVGACVGVRGFRIQNIIQEIRGEKIDIVVWNADITIYARNALAPAVVTKIIPNEETATLKVIVPNDQLSNAIGRRGQNVRLVTKLLGWKIDIYPENLYALESNSHKMLEQLASVAEVPKEKLLSLGYTSLRKFAEVTDAELMESLDIDEPAVMNLRIAINFMMDSYAKEDEKEGEVSPESMQSESDDSDVILEGASKDMLQEGVVAVFDEKECEE